MYNTIAYICFILSWIIAIAIVIDWLFISSLLPYFAPDHEYLIWLFIMIGLKQIYERIKTKPISTAIEELWLNRKIQKSKENGEEQPKTYKDFKEN